MNISTKVGSVYFDTPLILASGCITETPEFFLKAKPFGCAGMVTRSLRQNVSENRLQTPVPRYVVLRSGTMLNCEWSNENVWTNWLDIWVQKVKKTKAPIIVSLSGRDIAGCCELIKSFNGLNVDAYEINVSCAHSGILHGDLNIDREHLQALMTRVKKITNIPIWVKLSYSSFMIEMAVAAEKFGANAIVCTNSIGPGLLLDIETSEPKLGVKGGAGGMSGKAIFPIALYSVYEISRSVNIPVVGVGGISSAEDVIQMMMAGASAVQIYTLAALKGPRVFKDITKGLKQFFNRHSEYHSISDFIGISLKWAGKHSFNSPKPIIDSDKCTGCGLCLDSCVFDAIKLVSQKDNKLVAVIGDNCNSCNACVGACSSRNSAIRAVFGGCRHE